MAGGWRCRREARAEEEETMSGSELAAALEELAELREEVRLLRDRQEIFDCLHRFNRGLDRLDSDSIRSAYFTDAVDHHGPFKGSPEAFVEWVMEHMQAWDTSLHLLDLNNLTIEGDLADSECYVLFMQRRTSGGKLDFGGARYLDHLERRDGQWRITNRTLIVDWTAEADITSLPDTDRHPPGLRGKSDFSYQRPFVTFLGTVHD
jgi:hypothetical protein